jgi:hypothetical protein
MGLTELPTELLCMTNLKKLYLEQAVLGAEKLRN